jgi:hypothetical protein
MTDQPDTRLFDVDLKSLKELVNERDRLYTERATSQSTAVAAALAAQKEAAIKAEHYQSDYNIQHNDLMRKMDHQAELFIRRDEYTSSHSDFSKRLDAEAASRQADKDSVLKRMAEGVTEVNKRIDAEAAFRMNDREAAMKEIAALREYNSRGFGEKTAKQEDRTTQQWSTGMTVTIIAAVAGWLTTVVLFIMRSMPLVK